MQSSAETWKIASIEWPPYASPHIDGNGRAISALRAALEDVGIELKVEFMPWTRAQTVATLPEYVGYFPAWPEEVDENFVASNPVSWSLIGVVQRPNTKVTWSTVEDLFRNYRVGFIKNYVYPADLQREIDKHYDADGGSEDEQDLARILAAGRIDAALTDPIVMLHTAKQLSLEKIGSNVTILQKHPLVLAVSKSAGYQDRLDLLNSRLTINPEDQIVCCMVEPLDTGQPSAN